MPKESEIRKKAIQILKKEKWIVWWPSKVKFKQSDIFGTFDIICWKKITGNLKFIQLTTISNLSTRRKKIQNFFKKNKINPKIVYNTEVEIWAWNGNSKKFKIELI
jgi:hypothetical protein